MRGAAVIIRFDTRDFETWKATYAESPPAGARGFSLYRDVDVPSQVFALIRWDDADQARAYLYDTQTKARMLEAGVVGVPEVCLVQEIEW